MQAVVVAGKRRYPSKIVCVGRNYTAHIRELGNAVPEAMVVFNKPNSAITGILRAAAGGHSLHYESELAFLVEGTKLAAVGFGLDLTKRTLQTTLKDKGLPWERAKAFDGAALFSDFVPMENHIRDLSLQLFVDGQLRQAGGVDAMIYSPEAILEELASFTTLEDDDLIMTGTPAGVGAVEAGQRFHGVVLQGTTTLVEAHWLAV
jgi:2-keto-4-pentenoate hydratase/2-oxohepta-3-ene-1,7-dioic acid hydratase in catechol pathway